MKWTVVLVMVGLLSGCVTYVRPSDRVLIHDFAGNAAEMFVRIDDDGNCPLYVKTWAGGVARWAVAVDDLAHGRPGPTTAPSCPK